MDDSFSVRVHELVARCGGQSALARRTGLSLGAVQRYLKGGEPTRGALVRLAEACGVSMNWLVYGVEGGAPPVRDAGRTVIPVYGFAECGLQGWSNAVPYRIDLSADWPDPDLYAVIASGHSMAPEGIHTGFACIVSPNTRPRAGDAVLIRRGDHTATIKLYRGEDEHWLDVSGWLDPEMPGAPQMPFHDRIRKSTIESLAPVIMVRRRM